MSNINFDTTKEETEIIVKVMQRVHKLYPNTFQHMDLMMDLTACHCNGTALDFEKLLEFDDFNFSHDIFGISGHIDRNTGKLLNSFLP